MAARLELSRFCAGSALGQRSRKARQQAVSASDSQITAPDIFGGPAGDLEQDDLEFPFSQKQCSWDEATEEAWGRAVEKYHRNTNSAQAAPATVTLPALNPPAPAKVPAPVVLKAKPAPPTTPSSRASPCLPGPP